MNKEIIIGAFIISFLCSFFINAVARGIARKNNILIDLPDKNRKFHKRATPLTGGVSIFLGSILAIYLMQIMGIFSIRKLPATSADNLAKSSKSIKFICISILI